MPPGMPTSKPGCQSRASHFTYFRKAKLTLGISGPARSAILICRMFLPMSARGPERAFAAPRAYGTEVANSNNGRGP